MCNIQYFFSLVKSQKYFWLQNFGIIRLMKLEPGLKIDPEKETIKIVKFIKNALQKENFEKVILGSSGGLDSTTCLYLLTKVLPPKNIIVAYLPYFRSDKKQIESILKPLKIPLNNLYNIPIKNPVDKCIKLLKIKDKKSLFNRIRIGNIMARARMTILYDLTKTEKALVCGTSNKSESLLGYFTRFGDEAADIQPLEHLYKTQVYQLAKYLKVPQGIIDQTPTAGLWQGQTDEGELGFTYQEADLVLYFYLEKKLSLEKIKRMGFTNAEKITNHFKKNQYKHRLPYELI